MNPIEFINTNFSAAESAVIATILGWISSAFVQSLPDPDKDNGKFYRFCYKFLHTLAANWKLVDKQNKEDKAEGKTLFTKG